MVVVMFVVVVVVVVPVSPFRLFRFHGIKAWIGLKTHARKVAGEKWPQMTADSTADDRRYD